MENPSSPLDTLRQLKEMLDAGALTPSEFEALKQRLVFTSAPAAPAAPAAPLVAEVLPPASEPVPVAVAVAPEPEAVITAETVAMLAEPPPVPLVAPVPALPPQAEPANWAGASLPEPESPVPGNSSLGLVLAIGAVLVFLAVVAYLGFTRPATDEHISSISQTAADSLNTTIETGPQVAPLPATAAVPETVRVAPTNPAPVIRPRPAAPVADSVAPTTNSPASDSVGNQ